MKPKGTILILSLILLSIMMMLSISGTNNTLLNEKIASQQRMSHGVFQSAESVLLAGEHTLNQQISKPSAITTCLTPPCLLFNAAAFTPLILLQKNTAWWAVQGSPLPSALGQQTTSSFILQEITIAPDELDPQMAASGAGLHYYAIYGYSAGTQQSSILLESVYAIRYQ
jgi:Tfp pilus assembly protein PilX